MICRGFLKYAGFPNSPKNMPQLRGPVPGSDRIERARGILLDETFDLALQFVHLHAGAPDLLERDPEPHAVSLSDGREPYITSARFACTFASNCWKFV